MGTICSRLVPSRRGPRQLGQFSPTTHCTEARNARQTGIREKFILIARIVPNARASHKPLVAGARASRLLKPGEVLRRVLMGEALGEQKHPSALIRAG